MTTAALLLTLSACGDDESPEPDIGGESTSPAATPTPSEPTTEPSEPFDAEGSELHRGRVAADNATERAVADAWFAYWQVRVTAYHEAKVDTAALGEVARGEGVTEVVDYVAKLRQDGDHVIGDTRVSISQIRVRAGVAGIEACFESKGHFAGTPPYDKASVTPVVGTLAKVGDQWLVETQISTGEKCKR